VSPHEQDDEASAESGDAGPEVAPTAAEPKPTDDKKAA